MVTVNDDLTKRNFLTIRSLVSIFNLMSPKKGENCEDKCSKCA